MVPPTKSRGPALFLGLALAGFAAAAVSATDSAAAGPTRCEIALDAIPGGTRIEGRVIADSPVSGTYAMTILSRMGGGQASIQQAGAFDARPGTPARLGETELIGAPANHSVALTLTLGARQMTCRHPG